MDLFFAKPGDIVVAKIDLKNGAVGIIPDWENVVVTNHFTVYQPDLKQLVPEYLILLIQSKFFKNYLWRNKVGAEGRKEVKIDFFENIRIPLPSRTEQQKIVAHWKAAKKKVIETENEVNAISYDLNALLYHLYYQKLTNDILATKGLFLCWSNIPSWDVKTARAVEFRKSNPNFQPLGQFVEEATVLVRPYELPEKDWPVYGVNNKEGVFFSGYKRGADFNTAYKHIEKDWFFHNPTRSSVGSLGIVPDVPSDAITSPEYQVWRIREGLLPGYVATLIRTPFFIKLIQFHRVGAVKQRLYVENLLEIPIPVLDENVQREFADRREKALENIKQAREQLAQAKIEVEKMILGK